MKTKQPKRRRANHEEWTLWAIDCAKRVLRHFETKDRPRKTIDTVCVTIDASARAAARAAGHAAATPHAPAHARHAAAYALEAAGSAAAKEREWQQKRLPARLRPIGPPSKK